MPELRPLYIHTRQSQLPERLLTALKEAKQHANLGFMVKPVRAMYGQQGRVLAHREHPPFLCESIIVVTPADTKRALLWAVGESEEKSHGFVEKLSDWFGAPVIELEPEETVSKVKFE